MKRVLICTIARNARPHLDRWLSQLTGLVALVHGEYEVELSIAENDSTDGTTEWLRNTWERWVEDTKGSIPMHLSTDTLGTVQYGSVWSVDRLRNLAAARQRCLDQAGDLSRFDKVAFIEPDVTYDPAWCAELILARHPRAAGLGEPDVYSGWSLRSNANPKESVFLYDVCATRATEDDVTWDVNEQGGKWRAASVIPTDLGGHDAMCLHAVWSTFNGLCVYNARPFINGHKWTYWNRRINPGSGATVPHPDGGTAYLEADTAAMCETFHQYGYDKVYLNTNCLIRHA